MPLSIFRRHKPTCKLRRHGRAGTNCQCAIWVDGSTSRFSLDQPVSLHTRDWSEAESKAERMARDGEAAALGSVALSDAIQVFLRDCEVRGIAKTTIASYGRTLAHLHAYLSGKGIEWLEDISIDHLSKFRLQRIGKTGAPLAASTSRKELETIRGFFAVAVEREWIKRNPARQLRPPKDTTVPTQPFSRAEVESLLDASSKLDNNNDAYLDYARKRAHAAQLVLLHTGIRISDLARLRRGAVDPRTGYLSLRALKNKEVVKVKLPPEVIAALDQLPKSSRDYYFASGKNEFATVERSIRRTMEALRRLTKIDRVHPHRYRDTFAVELLNQGAELRHVQLLLGHRSIKTTEKHYAHFVAAQQALLDDATSRLSFGAAKKPKLAVLKRK